MYRVLASRAAVQERRPQRTHPEYKKPELMATGPNQVWSWDITRLLGPKKWSYFYLYVILDIFSRYAVGWMVADRENSALAGRLIQQSCLKYGVQPRVLTLHSAAAGAVGSDGIVLAPPVLDQHGRLRQRVEDLPVQQLVPELAVEALVVAVLPRAARLDKGVLR